jgi:hypothetical protein
MMGAYTKWAASNPQADAEGQPGITRGGQQWFEDVGAYPRMFFKVGAPNINDAGIVTNLFDGTPYASIVAADEDEAGVLEAEGWVDHPSKIKKTPPGK